MKPEDLTNWTPEAAVAKFLADAKRVAWVKFYCVAGDGSLRSSAVSEEDLISWLRSTEGRPAGFVGCQRRGNEAHIMILELDDSPRAKVLLQGAQRLLSEKIRDATWADRALLRLRELLAPGKRGRAN
ncbi:MAG: hypothetical protein WCC22_02225 [Terriglobales bacterium]